MPSRPPSPKSNLPQWKVKVDWLRYYVPVTRWLPHYSWSLFIGDAIAGLTVACLLIPGSMSYAANLAHIEPVHGLYAAAIPGITYFLLGTCKQLSVGGEAALSLLVGKTIAAQAHYAQGSIEYEQEAVIVCSIITALVGVFLFVFGLARLGFLDSILSKALLRGFITAVAGVILIEQLLPMLGLSALEARYGDIDDTAVDKLVFVLSNLKNTHVLTATLSISAVAILLIVKNIKKRLVKRYPVVQFIPEILIVVVGYTILTDVLNLDERGVSILGAVKSGHLEFRVPFTIGWSHVRDSIPTAITISVIGYVESIVAAKENSSRFNYSISPNRELVALGAANLVGSFFQTLPAFGAITRSKLNANFGARTQMAGLMTSLFVLISIFFLLPSFYYLPRCILASIIMVVAFGLLAELPADFKFMVRIGAWRDLALAFVTFLLTVFESVSVGTFVMVGLSLLLVVHQSATPRIQILGRIVGTNEFANIGDDEDGCLETYHGVFIVRVREPLTFANTGHLKERLRKLELYGPGKAHPSAPARNEEAHVVIFDMTDVESIDASAVQILGEITKLYKDRDVDCYFCQVRPEQRDLFEKAGILDTIGHDCVQATINDALEHEFGTPQGPLRYPIYPTDEL